MRIVVANTSLQYDEVTRSCREIFLKKTSDYGSSWTILRLPSLTDQIYIKARRIRSLEEGRVSKVGESIESEFQGIINYCVIALIMISERFGEKDQGRLDQEIVTRLYDAKLAEVRMLMEKKNHDYGEAWRDMRISSFTDLILMKILRLKQIEDNDGKVLISEGPEGSYADIINYSIFALIKLRYPDESN